MAAGSLGTSKITETRRGTELGFLFMAPPNLSFALAKLSWANNQLKILDAETRTFLARNCYRVIEDHHPDLAGRVLKVELTEAVPESIITNAGMLIQAIRDSMDYLAVALAVHNGAVKPTDVYFPITESKDGFFAQKV